MKPGKERRADLHVHSRWSDGSMTTEEILAAAKVRGLTHLAFTEHDFTASAAGVQALGKAWGIAVIPAVELSACDPETGRKVHILGYGYKKTETIEALAGPVRLRRHQNCIKQISVLAELGYVISPENVKPYAVGGVIYKQHILNYLVDSGQTDQLFGDVYRTVFKNGGPCDIDIPYAAAEAAVGAVCADGGQAVLAHPGQKNNLDLVPRLVAAGLQGIEGNHAANNRAAREQIAELAGRYGLFLTGGSDFHGAYEREAGSVGSVLAPTDCPLLI